MQKGILDRVEDSGMREIPPLVVVCSVLKEEDLKEENKWWCANTHWKANIYIRDQHGSILL